MIQPVTSPYADVFFWKTQQTIASNVVGANRAADRLQIESDAFFALYAFTGSTNYDNAAGDFIAVIGAGPAAARTLIAPPVVPNNFEVSIKYDSDNLMMGAPMPQGCICSNGYYGGRQLPFASIFPPMTSFEFEFFNTAPTLQTLADRTTAKDLVIDFGLYGYFVPVEMIEKFLVQWPAYQQMAQQNPADWIQQFTAIDVPTG